ncbi:MAG TPA: diacylglycerol kinase family protein [Gemmatimonadaceae bacterium]|nr:diacylglycerol kinase family protein [Gemmatimonadaceae bacterium]
MPATRLVFFNPASGSAWIAERTLRAVERLASVPGTQVHGTVPGSIAEQVRTHLTADVVRVYAIGGDGTVGDVATALVDTTAALGIIPCGTTNVLAREYGIPLRTRRAVDVLEASDRTVLLRTWEANGHTAVLGAGVGWDARVMYKSPQAMKQRAGRTGVAMVGFREIATYDFPPLVVTGTNARDEPVELRGTSVILATVKRWAGGNTGIPDADPSDDLIDVVVLESHSRLHLATFWALMTLPGGRPLTLHGVRAVQLKRARVECEDGRAVEAHVNGEPVTHTPFTMEPGGVVRVIVP